MAEGEVVGVSDGMVPFERAMVVSYKLMLSSVTIALSVSVWPQFATECVRRSNQQEVGHFGGKLLGRRVDRCKPNFKVLSLGCGLDCIALYLYVLEQ